MTSSSSAGSRNAAYCFLSRAFLDRDLHRSARVLPRASDYLQAAVPLALWPDPWTGIQARARVDLARQNRENGTEAGR